MSEHSEEEEQPQLPPKEEPGKRFFISNLNSYVGKTLLQELRNEHLVREPDAAHSFQGTLQQDEPGADADVPPEGVERIVSRERTKQFREQLLTSDVIVYDLMATPFEEADYVIKTLKSSELAEEKTLILISSVMTWVNTPPKLE